MKPLYIALDSDALINFAEIYAGSNKIYLKTDTVNRIQNFLNDIKNNNLSIRFVVTSVVFNEVHNPQMKNPAVDNFIKNFCCIPVITPHELNYAKKIDKLATSYSEVKEDGSLSPMKQVYSAAGGAYVPSNDAYIMAEASTLGISLVTFNDQDYVAFGKKIKSNKTRAHEILNINRTYNCFYEDYSDRNKQVAPRPYHVMEFINLVYSDKFLHFPAPKVQYAPKMGKNQVKFNDDFLIR